MPRHRDRARDRNRRPAPAWSCRALIALVAAGMIVPACAPDRRRVTPTTTGTNLRTLPRGRMTPLPFPGSSLARADRAGDPATTTAAHRDQTVR